MSRKHVATLIRKMGIEALYRKANTSRRHPAPRIYPYLLQGLAIEHPQPGLGDGYDLHSNASRLRVFDGRARLGQSSGARLARVFIKFEATPGATRNSISALE